MKRSGILPLALLLALCAGGVLSGCLARGSSSASLHIGYSFFNPKISWQTAYLKAFKEQLKGHPNLDIAWFDGSSEPAAIPAAIEGWIAGGIDLIISSTPDHMPLRNTYRKALEAGIPVMLTGDPPDYRVWEYMTIFSGFSGWDASRMSAELLVQTLGGKGAVACITGPRGSTSEQQNTEGFTSTLRRLSTGIQVAVTADGRWNPTVAYQEAMDILSRFPTIDAFSVTEDAMGTAVVRALREKGYAPGDVLVVSQGGSRESIADLEEGWYLALVNQDPVRCARQDIWLLQAALEKGRPVPHVAQARQEMITKTNTDLFGGW